MARLTSYPVAKFVSLTCRPLTMARVERVKDEQMAWVVPPKGWDPFPAPPKEEQLVGVAEGVKVGVRVTVGVGVAVEAAMGATGLGLFTAQLASRRNNPAVIAVQVDFWGLIGEKFTTACQE